MGKGDEKVSFQVGDLVRMKEIPEKERGDPFVVLLEKFMKEQEGVAWVESVQSKNGQVLLRGSPVWHSSDLLEPVEVK